jgi:hypothetical protein
MRSQAEFDRVHNLIRLGVSDPEIARLTGIPRPTVYGWRRGRGRRTRARERRYGAHWRPPDEERYCYLLGLYLGDGCISFPKQRAAVLRVYFDAAHPRIAQEAVRAVRAMDPAVHVHLYRHPVDRVVTLQSHGLLWRYAIPQHGPGRKHLRRIMLTDWQVQLTRQYPEALLRGLIHSDGCRCHNRFEVKLPSGRVGQYEYVRYFFSNKSAEIRRIFCDHCELLGIRWTQSNLRNISIAHRDSVRLLESFVGPKC